MVDKPTGGIDEYEALNSLVNLNDQSIVDRTVEIYHLYGWGICRCRMAAIIESTARRFGWRVDAQRRAVVIARWRPNTKTVSVSGVDNDRQTSGKVL